MEKKFLIENIEKLTPQEKEILEKLFKDKKDIDLVELINNIKKDLKEAKEKEVYNKLLNRLTQLDKDINGEAERWWKQALYELETSETLIKSNKYSSSAFHSQQAVEMALKALYLKRKGEVPEHHKLLSMATILSLPENLKIKCNKLDPIYLQTRYVDTRSDEKLPYEQYDEEQAIESYNDAEELLKWISKETGLSII